MPARSLIRPVHSPRNSQTDVHLPMPSTNGSPFETDAPSPPRSPAGSPPPNRPPLALPLEPAAPSGNDSARHRLPPTRPSALPGKDRMCTLGPLGGSARAVSLEVDRGSQPEARTAAWTICCASQISTEFGAMGAGENSPLRYRNSSEVEPRAPTWGRTAAYRRDPPNTRARARRCTWARAASASQGRWRP